MNTGNCSGTQQALHLLRTHVHNCWPLVPEINHTVLHNLATSVALHNVTFMITSQLSSKNGSHLFSNCNMTTCHTVEATECWKTRINSCSSDTLTEIWNEECLMRCDTALLGSWFMIFWRNMSTLSSWTDYLERWRWHNPSQYWKPLTQCYSHTTED